MGDEEGHGGTGGSSATVAQPSTSQSPMFHQILPPQPLALRPSGEALEGKVQHYFVKSWLDRENLPYQLAMFKHMIGDGALKVIKIFTGSYTEGKDLNNWCMIMDKMEQQCIGEVNEIYQRYCFNKGDRLPTSSLCCLRDSLISDRIVLGIKDEQTTKKLLRIRDLTLNWCIDICRSEEVTVLHMKSLWEPVDNINQVKSKKTKPRVSTLDKQSGNKISCKFCGHEHAPERKKYPAWGKVCKRCKKKNHFAKGCKDAVVNAIESDKTWKRSVL